MKEEKGLAAIGGVSPGSTTDRSCEDVGESAEARKRIATRLIETHDAVFRRTARRYSICADDADDAYQRALEILLTKAPPLEGDAIVRWMQVVTKREALSVRRQRERLLSGPTQADPDDERDPLDSIASESAGPNEQAASRERVARSREALRALKPQELRALTLKAQGYSYAEIGEITGWTYTKINRCMAEGRKRFLETFASIEEGRRCGQLSMALSALADGERDVVGAEDVQVHLRTCGSCRAKLRAFRAIPDRVLELMPTGPTIDQSTGGRAHEWLSDRVGGAIDKIREASYSAASRGPGSESEAAAGLAGGLQASAAKALAVCGIAVAGTGGAYCAVNGVAPNDLIDGTPGSQDQTITKEPSGEVRPPEHIQLPSPAPTASTEPQEQVTTSPDPPLTQAQQTSKELGFEQAAPSSGAPASGGEFSAPAGGGGSSGGSGGGGGGFGFE